MCGIAGRYAHLTAGQDPRSFRAPPQDLKATLARVGAMVQVLHHRGPDEQATETFGPVVFGHGRLKIRDLSPLARQPMVTPDGRYVLTYNGEIYNHAELRRELEAQGVTLRSTGDTEVLLKSLVHFGDGVLARLNGEFAFAFLDTHTGRLLLARDPYGIKPLAYVEAEDGFWFASEPKALLEPAGPAARVADESAIERYFVEGILDVGAPTFFQGVRYLPGCHKLVVEGGRVTHLEPYRPYPHETPVAGDPEAVLQRAIELRLEADVRVGASLSGGLDSGTLVTIAGKLYGPGFPTFTAAMDDPSLDETPLATQTAKAAEASPTFVPCTPPTPEEMVELLKEQGAPVETFSEFAKRRMVRAARDARVIVLLEGKGADEVFGGYPHYQAARLAELLRRLRFARFLKEARIAPPGTITEALYFLLPRVLRSLLRRIVHRRVRALLDPGLRSRNPLPPAPRFTHASRLKAALAESLTLRGLPSLLRYADRFTMAASVEGRYAYLDPDLVSTVFSLPDEDLVSDGRTKRALRRIAQGRVPEEILKNPTKVNFTAPERAWLTAHLHDMFRQHLTDGRLDQRGWLRPGAGAALYRNFLKGEDTRLAIRAFMLEAWARIFLDPSAEGDLRAPSARRSQIRRGTRGSRAQSASGLKASPSRALGRPRRTSTVPRLSAPNRTLRNRKG